MGYEKKYQIGETPKNPTEEISGLKEAIENTRRRIAEYRAGETNASEFELHLKSLECRLEKVEKKLKGEA